MGRRAWPSGLVRRFRDDERGVGIVLAVSVTAIVLIVGIGWSQMATHQVAVSAVVRNREQAIAAAEAGVNKAITLLTEQPNLMAIPLTAISLGGNTYGKYEVSISTPPAPVPSTHRLITSTGYGPDETAANRGQRTIEAEIELLPTDSFEFALMAGQTTFAGGNNVDLATGVTVAGDVFASGYAKWGAGANISGNVSTWGGIDSRGTVAGTLHTAGLAPGSCPAGPGSCSVAIRSGSVGNVIAVDDNATPGVEGRVDVWQNSPLPDPDPQVTGSVATLREVNVQTSRTPATGTIYQIQSLPPPKYVLPTFTWGTYTSQCGCVPLTYDAGVSIFQTYFKTNYALGISGTHDVTPLVASGTVELGGTNLIGLPITTWNMAGNVVIYTDRPVRLSANVANPSGTPKKLVIISSYSGGDAVTFAGTLTIASTVDVLVYAPGNRVFGDASMQTLKGSIYAKQIADTGGFNIGEGTTLNTVPGFDWPMITYAPVRTLLFKEAPS